MGQEDIHNDSLDGTAAKGCAEDERRTGRGERNEDRHGISVAEHRLQGPHEPDSHLAGRIQDSVQPLCSRRIHA